MTVSHSVPGGPSQACLPYLSFWHRSPQLMSAVLVQPLRARPDVQHYWMSLAFYCSGLQGHPVFLHGQVLHWGTGVLIPDNRNTFLGGYCRCLINRMSQDMTLVLSVSPRSHSISSSSQSTHVTFLEDRFTIRQFLPKSGSPAAASMWSW